MIAGGDTRITEIAVIADAPRPVPPCGGCRQKLAEFGGGDTKVTLATTRGEMLETKVSELLPGAFSDRDMA
jgi:cytidine deaminase